MTSPPLLPRAAATLILARDGAQGIEVFMMQRTHQADFLAGAVVFPGGALDAADRDPAWAAHRAASDKEAGERALEGDELAYRVAAIRECFEESGYLLASDAQGSGVELRDPTVVEQYAMRRKELISGALTLADLCRGCDLHLRIHELAYFSRWITPVAAPRRYDTRFFVAAAPPAQTPSHDDEETIDHFWIRPADALARRDNGEMTLVFATVSTLEALHAFADVAALMAHARALPAIAPRLAWPAMAGKVRRMLLAGDAAYAEVQKLDPDGKALASCEILPGVVTRLSARVRRIAAPNPSFMTGPGTNTYLIGDGDDLAVIDPGPALDVHVQAILAESGGRVRSIFVTHTHLDHSPAALMLKEQTGATLYGMPAPAGENQDQVFQPDRVLAHGERIAVAGATLRVIHTPGHASNHLCYLLEEEQLLFTGDHIMQGSTVVINPPDGDMSAYCASLRALQEEQIAFLAPGHGFLMDRPQERIARLLAHRLARENKVCDALSRDAAATELALLARVYDDVPPARHKMASRSLLAHLVKLEGEGRATRGDGKWLAPQG